MEIWISILISGVLTAASIIVGAYIGSRQIAKVVEAIHADIKHSQEKLEQRIREEK